MNPSFTILLLLSSICLCSTFANLDVPNRLPEPFFASTNSVINDLSNLSTKLYSFVIPLHSDNYRLSNAISDCKELLDMSLEELDMIASAAQNPFEKHNSTEELSSDLLTWISAVLANHDTCIEGFNGTETTMKTYINKKLNKVNLKVMNLLPMVKLMRSPADSIFNSAAKAGGHRHGGQKSQFPSWVTREGRKLLAINKEQADVIVSKDETGNYTSITQAVHYAPKQSLKPYIIYIKKGIYNEYVDIKKNKWNIVMIGDGMGETVITGDHNYVDGWTTFKSSTFGVAGMGFIARDLTIENVSGPNKFQAVALRVDSDHSVFYKVEIKGFQDTLYAHSMRQFYQECKISGTVDFIFGSSTTVFQKCKILARKGMSGQTNVLTAHGRKTPDEPTGFSLQFCNISADIELLPALSTTQTYLGRPWKPYSRTIFMQSYLSNIISPKGWLEWRGTYALETLYYGEYSNSGPGSGLTDRVNWPGYHVLNKDEANKFTVSNFIEGNKWLPNTGVNFASGFEQI